MSNGFIFYETKDIVCILTPDTSNPKTGDEGQTWIIYKHEPPHVAIYTGKDSIIFGDCKHRGKVLSIQDALKNSNILSNFKSISN
jgi:hypothetical protein